MAKKAKKVGKRMAMGGAAMNSGVAAMTPRRGKPVSRQDIKNAVARPMPSPGPGMPMRPPMMRPEVMPGAGVAPMPRGGMRGGMRGGGLAKKGVGMALAKGGMVKGAGCAKRGVKKPEYR